MFGYGENFEKFWWGLHIFFWNPPKCFISNLEVKHGWFWCNQITYFHVLLHLCCNIGRLCLFNCSFFFFLLFILFFLCWSVDFVLFLFFLSLFYLILFSFLGWCRLLLFSLHSFFPIFLCLFSFNLCALLLLHFSPLFYF